MTQERLVSPPHLSISNFLTRGTRRLVRAAETGFAKSMRVVPLRYRFQVALLCASAAVPFFCKTRAYRKQQIKNFHTPREIALFLLLNALSKSGTPIDLNIAVDGYQNFLSAYGSGNGVLVIGHHAALTQLMVRHFYDNDLDPIVITPDREMRVPGTEVMARTLQPSPLFLVELRSKLRQGALVCAMPDRAEHHVQRTVEFSTPAGRVIVAPAIIQVAYRCNACVLFTEVRLKGSRLVAVIGGPSSTSPQTVEGITEEFVSFIKERTAALNFNRARNKSLDAVRDIVRTPTSKSMSDVEFH